MHELSLSFAATTAAIRAMPAGLEMDVAVAKVLGYAYSPTPCYSTDHGRAMEALHQFCKRHQMTCRVSYDGLEDDVPWHVSIAGARLRDCWTMTTSPGLPGLALACCRAILLAAAGEQPDGW